MRCATRCFVFLVLNKKHVFLFRCKEVRCFSIVCRFLKANWVGFFLRFLRFRHARVFILEFAQSWSLPRRRIGWAFVTHSRTIHNYSFFFCYRWNCLARMGGWRHVWAAIFMTVVVLSNTASADTLPVRKYTDGTIATVSNHTQITGSRTAIRGDLWLSKLNWMVAREDIL